MPADVDQAGEIERREQFSRAVRKDRRHCGLHAVGNCALRPVVAPGVERHGGVAVRGFGGGAGERASRDEAAPRRGPVAKHRNVADAQDVTNLVLGLNRAALAEGLAFAGALGLEGSATLDVMRHSMAYSRIMDTKGEKMVRRDFAPQAKLAQHLKDVRLMLEATDLALPLTGAHRALLEKAVALGCGELDNSAIIRAYEEEAAADPH